MAQWKRECVCVCMWGRVYVRAHEKNNNIEFQLNSPFLLLSVNVFLFEKKNTGTDKWRFVAARNRFRRPHARRLAERNEKKQNGVCRATNTQTSNTMQDDVATFLRRGNDWKAPTCAGEMLPPHRSSTSTIIARHTHTHSSNRFPYFSNSLVRIHFFERLLWLLIHSPLTLSLLFRHTSPSLSLPFSLVRPSWKTSFAAAAVCVRSAHVFVFSMSRYFDQSVHKNAVRFTSNSIENTRIIPSVWCGFFCFVVPSKWVCAPRPAINVFTVCVFTVHKQ